MGADHAQTVRLKFEIVDGNDALIAAVKKILCMSEKRERKQPSGRII